jgi:DNA polymerase-3 subunit gamma/tau
VHQLTEAAFNALLKTLEEPPPHIVFVLATTDPRDIPATVLSRVQRFDFRPIPPDTLVKSLERILDEERIPFEPAALPQVVRAADGSLRDALSLLDTAIAYGSGRVDAETVRTLLGTTAPVEVRAFAAALVAHDTTAALLAIDRAAREGEDLESFGRDVLELLRRMMVLRAAPTAQLTDLTPTEANELRTLGARVTLDELLYLVRAFLDADAEMRESPHPRVELEIAAVRATRRPVPEAVEDLLRRVDSAEQRLREHAFSSGGSASAPTQESLLSPAAPRTESRRGPGPTAPGPTASAPAAGPSASAAAAPASKALAREPAARSRAASPPPGAAVAGRGEPANADAGASRRPDAPDSAEGPAPGDAGSRPRATGDGSPVDTVETAGEEPGDAWQLVVGEVMKTKPMIAGTLMQARPAGLADGVLRVALTGNHFHRDLLADRAYRDIVLQAIRRNFPGALDFTIVNEQSGARQVTDHPAVQAAIATFQGEVVAVRPRAPLGEGQ